MFKIITWMCFVSLCFLVIQVMIYFCKDVISIFNNIKHQGNVKCKKPVISTVTYEYKEKVAK